MAVREGLSALVSIAARWVVVAARPFLRIAGGFLALRATARLANWAALIICAAR